jgi:hypothetical protein
MPAPLQSAQFRRIWLADSTGTLQEVTGNVTQAQYPRGSKDTNLTAFMPGGGPATENHIRGAAQSNVTMTLLHDDPTAALLNQIVAARTGIEIRIWEGNNNIPQVGDPIFRGTYTLFGASLTYNANQNAAWACDFSPTDSGAITPGWTR